MDLIDGHVYSDGEHAFAAIEQVDHTDVAWSLFRVIRKEDTLCFPSTPGDLVGYSLARGGYWDEVRIGDPAKGENRLTALFSPAFEDEIMPTLEDIADSINVYLFIGSMF